jgi:hypothetical protein
VNFAAKNADANTASLKAAQDAALAVTGTIPTGTGLDTAAVTNIINVIATKTAENKVYPAADQSDKYAFELNTYMSDTKNLPENDRTSTAKVAAARVAFDGVFNAKYRGDGYTATKEKITAAVALATSAETLGVGATKAQIAAATRKATASVIAYDNAVTEGVAAGTAAAAAADSTYNALTDAQKAVRITARTAAVTSVAIADAIGMKTSVKFGQIFWLEGALKAGL